MNFKHRIVQEICLFLVLLLATGGAQAQVFENFPGSVPLKVERQAASDLVFGNEVLTPDQARELYDKKIVADLSFLNPDESSELWKNVYTRFEPLDLVEMQLNKENEELTFISDKSSPNGQFSFLAQKKNQLGELKTYQIYLDTKGHNMLLRRSLLRKLGYKIPWMGHLKTVTIKFPGAFSKREFAKRISDSTFVSSSRWITHSLQTEDEYLGLQDVFVFEGPDDTVYNLARGQMDGSIIRGRRVLNSLLLPYSLTDIPESVNLASWVGAGIFNGMLYLPCPDAESFSPSYEDALWIGRRILKLKREDWVDITRAADLPIEVSVVLTEKLISRRNALRKSLGLYNEFPEIMTNSNLTISDRLKNGKLVGESWIGYARHFAGTDPASPLSGQEMWGLFKTKFISNLINNLMTQFNSRFVPSTDVAYKVFDHQLNLAAKNFADFLMTKKLKQNPVALWSTPFYNGQILASRDIVAGNYMGSDNLVQLADTVGISINLGLAAVLDNLPTNVAASGNAQLSLVHKYSHLKPLNSIKAGLSEPFKNMFIPYLRFQTKRPLEEALALEHQVTVLDPEELKIKLDKLMAEATHEFGVGESLIVQTSISPSGYFQISKGFSSDISAYARINDELVDIYRAQILRKDEKTVHIYIDPATYNSFGIALGLSLAIPIVELGEAWEFGTAKTNYFSLNLDTDVASNPQFFNHLRVFISALRGASLDSLKQLQQPWLVKHRFADDRGHFKFLWWNSINDDFKDSIEVVAPGGYSAQYIRKALGQRSGENYESIVTDILNYLLFDKFKIGVGVSSNNTGNPGDTIFGQAISRQTLGETELQPKGTFGQVLAPLDNAFLSVNYRWKGWQMNKKKLIETSAEINKKFGSELIQKGQFNDILKLQFYNISVQVALYKQGIKEILSKSVLEITDIFRNYSSHPSPTNNPKVPDITGYEIRHMNKLIRATREEINKPPAQINYDDVIENLTEIVDICESQLTSIGFKKIVGGEKNIFVGGAIVGFRKGSENGNQPLQMQTIGKIGSDLPQGPLQFVQSKMKISPGEFYINWLINGF